MSKRMVDQRLEERRLSVAESKRCYLNKIDDIAQFGDEIAVLFLILVLAAY